MRPGPAVTAMPSIFSRPDPASARARSTTGTTERICSREASSGTTPPYRLWTGTWEETMLARRPAEESYTAAAVSSHELSMPRTRISSTYHKGAPKRGLLRRAVACGTRGPWLPGGGPPARGGARAPPPPGAPRPRPFLLPRPPPGRGGAGAGGVEGWAQRGRPPQKGKERPCAGLQGPVPEEVVHREGRCAASGEAPDRGVPTAGRGGMATKPGRVQRPPD